MQFKTDTKILSSVGNFGELMLEGKKQKHVRYLLLNRIGKKFRQSLNIVKQAIKTNFREINCKLTYTQIVKRSRE